MLHAQGMDKRGFNDYDPEIDKKKKRKENETII
jgi:hypothetical protein